MRIPNAELFRVFKKVHAVREHMKLYHVDAAGHRLSVDSLTESIADMYGLMISRWEVFASGSHIAGNVERYADGRAVILINSDLNETMRRLVTVKELCHLMIDEADDWSAVGTDTIDEMKVEVDSYADAGGGVQNPSRVQLSELLALVAALALMYPCEFHEADMQRIADDQTTVAKIGLYHDTPPHMIEWVFRHAHLFRYYGPATDQSPSDV